MKQNINEIWRDIIGYEDYYEVSNLGRIRSLDRTVLTKTGERFYKGKIMKSFFNKGYKMLALSRDGKTRKFLIHQLVAMAFLDHEPNGHTLVVDHVNGDTLNNRVENLQIVTHRENLSTCYRANKDLFSSSYVGVDYHKRTNKWRSKIRHKGKQIFLGQFDNEIDASDTYQKALAKINDGTFNPENYEPSFASKYKSVYFNKDNQKWFARPTINGKNTYLGYHPTEESAHQAILEYEAIQPIEK